MHRSAYFSSTEVLSKAAIWWKLCTSFGNELAMTNDHGEDPCSGKKIYGRRVHPAPRVTPARYMPRGVCSAERTVRAKAGVGRSGRWLRLRRRGRRGSEQQVVVASTKRAAWVETEGAVRAEERL
ncbi:hypothetical protein GUJ93_ZPchr0013g37352 [Zizania palustris]|uniref:Uncharacterized protein n=1 Tax=Zizania palustris TaxID=103762 RepID=A0A8J6C4C0_ZIZPA|nr:hypothetical protein GUJ93_ZPchr0013g37352 [Zizania palustris]